MLPREPRTEVASYGTYTVLLSFPDTISLSESMYFTARRYAEGSAFVPWMASVTLRMASASASALPMNIHD